MSLHLSLGELIAAIPIVLGGKPRECVVAVSLNAEGLPTFAMVVPRHVLLDRRRAPATAASIAEEFSREGSQFVVLASYSESNLREGCAALDALLFEVEFAVPHVEAVAVTEVGWFRPGCAEPSCCPPAGRPLPPVPERLPVVLADARRRAVASQRYLAKASARVQERRVAAAEWGRALDSGVVEDAGTARRLAAVLDDLCVRDWVVLSILGAEPDAAQDALNGIETGAVAAALDGALAGDLIPDPRLSEHARTVIERVARAARGRRRRAATNTLAAVVEWWDGNLTAALQRCDIALESDSGYRLAELVRLASARGIAPGWTQRTGQIV